MSTAGMDLLSERRHEGRVLRSQVLSKRLKQLGTHIKTFHLDFVVFVFDAQVEVVARISANDGSHVSGHILDQGL